MIDWRKLSEDVRIERARRRVDQKTAASEIGIAASSLCRLEGEKSVSADNFMAICRWLGRPAETTLR
jgi:DNA-binding Xre family transcriptional regulator